MFDSSKGISILYRYCQKNIESRLKDIGISGGTYYVLLAVLENEGASVDGLAALTELDKSTVTRALHKLTSDGFVDAQISRQDKRRRVVRPTEKARSMHEQILEAVRGWDEDLTVGLSPAERAQMDALLEKLATRALIYLNKNAENE